MMIRIPLGVRVQRNFLASTTVQNVLELTGSEVAELADANFELMMAYPRKIYTDRDERTNNRTHYAAAKTPRQLSPASSGDVKSPSEMELMSIPQTNTSKRVSMLQVHNLLDGEINADVMPDVLSKQKSFQLRRRMTANPKLAAIIAKCDEAVEEDECEMQDVKQESGLLQTTQN